MLRASRTEPEIDVADLDPRYRHAGWHDDCGRCWGGALSRAERLEIISLVAAVGMSECVASIIPLLERGTPDEE
jgi:hypothetical protein